RFHGGVHDLRSGRLQAIGGLMAAAMVAWSCGGPPTSSRPMSPAAASAPTGFTPFDGTKLGFAIALAPGWMVARTDLGSGASFGGPDGLVMLVHFEQSVAADLDTATGTVLFDLTGGSGVRDSKIAAATLAGRRAKRVAGRFSGPGAVTAIEAYVM